MSCIAPFCPATSARQHFWVPPRSGCPALRVGAGASAMSPSIAALQAQVQAKGDAVKALKEKSAPKPDIDAAVNELKELKIALEGAVKAATEENQKEGKAKEAFRSKLATLLEHRLFYIPSFKIYGGVAGLYDYGPTGCAIKANVTAYWRKHFVLEEGMMEVECPSVTPEVVLKASGHVDRFNDLMVKDTKTQDCYRADHLLKAHLENMLTDPLLPAAQRPDVEQALATLDELKAAEMDAAFAKFGVKAPETKNDLSPAFEFNLMFGTLIGPSGQLKGYLRPETAQGIFVNFRDLLYHNGGKLPFACAQIGQSFRNEIAPRAGLLRVREFTQAEIEHFVHPEQKDHPRFSEVAHLELNLFSQGAQLSEARKPLRMTIGEAVAKKVVANQTLGYFVARCYLFLVRLGVDENRLRFRQHLAKEMAHYAEDCWDAEIESTYGWVECVGMADRSAFDLNAHATKSKVDLTAYEKFAEPREVTEFVCETNKQLLGKELKKDAKLVTDALEAMCEADLVALGAKLAAEGSAQVGGCTITKDMVRIEHVTKMVSGRAFTPGVIEPSFGLGRIMYCLFEHSFYWRENDEQRLVLRLNPLVAPIKVTVFPLLNDERLVAHTQTIATELTAAGIFNKVDTTGTTIGKRYARTDEIGVPFAITVDFDSLENGTVTLRERDSTQQVRVPKTEVVAVVAALVNSATWSSTVDKYPKQAAAAEE